MLKSLQWLQTTLKNLKNMWMWKSYNSLNNEILMMQFLNLITEYILFQVKMVQYCFFDLNFNQSKIKL